MSAAGVARPSGVSREGTGAWGRGPTHKVIKDELQWRTMTWQRTNIQAAAAYLRERMAAGAVDAPTRAVYEGLLEVLDPTRRAARVQREKAEAAKAAAAVEAERDRRNQVDRRGYNNRRMVNLGPPQGVERRSGADRRAGRDRRSGRP